MRDRKMEQSDFNQGIYGDDVIDVAPAKPKLKKPPMYKVVMLNDNYTPQVFVIWLLQKLFNMDNKRATMLMLTVHKSGQGVCGVFPYDIAEMKVVKAHQYARQNNHPLRCRMEPE